MTDRTTTHDPAAGTGQRSVDRPGSESGYGGAGTGTDAAGASSQRSDASEHERARRAAEDIKSAAKDAAASTSGAVRSRLTGELDYRKYKSRQRINRVVSALRDTGSKLHGEDEAIASYADRAADGLERVAQYLDQKDVSAMMDDARRAARQRPEIFVGSLFFAGLMLGRFLRSSTPEPGGHRRERRTGYPGGQSGYPGQDYGGGYTGASPASSGHQGVRPDLSSPSPTGGFAP